MKLRSLLALTLCATCVAPASAGAIVPSTPDAPGYNVNGDVRAIVRVGDTIYIGGSFTTVNGQPRTNLAAISAADGSVLPWAPATNGTVWSLVASGSTIYIGGQFGAVTDATAHTRHALAAIDSAGNVLPWDPDTGATGQVFTLAISGSTVYVGGRFTTLGVVTESDLGAVDTSTGAVVNWGASAPNPSNDVLALGVSPDGNFLYVGGNFLTIGSTGANRNGLAALNPATAAVDTTWNPSDPTNGGSVGSLDVGPSGTVYVGGDYFGAAPTMGFATRQYVAEVAGAGNGSTGAATSWAADADADVTAIASAADTVYIGGIFNNVNTQRTPVVRNGLAATNLSPGDALAWDPSPGTSVDALYLAPDGSLYVGGSFAASPTLTGFASFSPPPAATATPSVDGTPQPAQTLTCSQGTWSGATPQTYSTQLLYDGAPLGSAGATTYTPTDADVGHTIGCAVTSHNRTANVTANAVPVTIQAAPSTPPPALTPPPSTLPPPVFRKSANLYPQAGSVLVKIPGSKSFVALSVPEQIPFGSIIDATHGTVRICTADRAGKVFCSDFYGGVFKLTQTTDARPITVLTLAGGNFKACRRVTARRATEAVKRSKSKSVRHLWGTGSGPFRTVGRFASATIRGTTWLTDDRCDGTLIRVKRGVVGVRDLVKRRSLALRAPRRYLARAGRIRRG